MPIKNFHLTILAGLSQAPAKEQSHAAFLDTH